MQERKKDRPSIQDNILFSTRIPSAHLNVQVIILKVFSESILKRSSTLLIQDVLFSLP
jgi:hypothetical protein